MTASNLGVDTDICELTHIFGRRLNMNRHRRRTRRGSGLKYYLIAAFLVIAGALGLSVYKRPESIIPIKFVSPASIAADEYIIKLNSAVTSSSAGVLMAISDDLFQQAGLSIQLLPGSDDADATSAVSADDHTIGLASTQGFLKARAEGAPIVAFAASYARSPLEFYALSSTPLIKPSDIEGRRIGFKAGVEATTILNAFIAANSISQSTLRLFPSDTPTSDLLDGKTDVLLGDFAVDGPVLEQSKRPYHSLSPDSFGVHAMGSVYFANERALASSDNLKRFFVALNKGWILAYSDYQRTLPIIMRSIENKMDFTQLSRLMDAQRRFLRPSGARFGELDLQRVKNLQNQLLQQRIIKEPLDLSRAFNDTILTEVYRTMPADFF